jgi:hypothetical protein
MNNHPGVPERAKSDQAVPQLRILNDSRIAIVHPEPDAPIHAFNP